MLVAAVDAGAAPQTLTLCSENADVRPWRTTSRQGLNFVLLDRAAALAGVSFVYDMAAWPRCLARLKSGEVDGVFAASFKSDRLDIGAFPGGESPDARKRLYTDRYVAVRKRGHPVDWNGRQFTGLDGRIGKQLGYSINDTLKRLGLPTDDGAQSADALLQKLAADRVPVAAMLAGEVAAVLAANERLAREVEILPTPLEEKPYYLMLSHKLQKASPHLATSIWNAIETVRQSRDYQQEERAALATPAR